MIHDKLWQFGGGERVAKAIRELWEGADLFTSTYDEELVREHEFGEVKATLLQRTPSLERAHHYFLPFYDRAFRSLDLRSYDLVVSSSSMFAKSARPPAGVPHLCYCHTPPRFLWDLREELVDELPRSAPVKAVVAGLSRWLQGVDLRAAERVTRFVANSAHVARRIEVFYGRQADVVYPPVDISKPRRGVAKGDHVLVLARLYPYKRVDLVIKACNTLGLPLVVVGDGTDRARLEGLAGPNVSFRGWIPEWQKDELLESARVMVAPQVEDFGIATVEAIAAGTPVLSFSEGGATEIVAEGVNGSFFDQQSTGALTDALSAFDETAFDPIEMRASVERFAPGRFEESLRAIAAELLEDQTPS